MADQAAKIADFYTANRMPEAQKLSESIWKRGKPVVDPSFSASRSSGHFTMTPSGAPGSKHPFADIHCLSIQSNTVGNRVTVSLRDTGAEVCIERPEMVNFEDIITGKTMSVT